MLTDAQLCVCMHAITQFFEVLKSLILYRYNVILYCRDNLIASSLSVLRKGTRKPCRDWGEMK